MAKNDNKHCQQLTVFTEMKENVKRKRMRTFCGTISIFLILVEVICSRAPLRSVYVLNIKTTCGFLTIVLKRESAVGIFTVSSITLFHCVEYRLELEKNKVYLNKNKIVIFKLKINLQNSIGKSSNNFSVKT